MGISCEYTPEINKIVEVQIDEQFIIHSKIIMTCQIKFFEKHKKIRQPQFKKKELFMKRREFLTTTSGALCFTHLVKAEEYSFKGEIKKAVKFGSKPNDQKMQNLKSFDE